MVTILFLVIAPILIGLISIIHVRETFALVFGLFMIIFSFWLVKFLFSKVCFSKNGVNRKLLSFSYITIPWDNCVDVGIGGAGEDAMYDCIYFSKAHLTNEQINKISTLKQNREHIWCACDDAVLAEVMQYVDKDRIRNLDLYESVLFE